MNTLREFLDKETLAALESLKNPPNHLKQKHQAMSLVIRWDVASRPGVWSVGYDWSDCAGMGMHSGFHIAGSQQDIRAAISLAARNCAAGFVGT